jgi:hypothetical protein
MWASYDLLPMSLVLTKGLGFCYSHIATLIDDAELAERIIQVQSDLTPSGKQLDTFAAEFPTNTIFLFATYAWFVVIYCKDIIWWDWSYQQCL